MNPNPGLPILGFNPLLKTQPNLTRSGYKACSLDLLNHYPIAQDPNSVTILIWVSCNKKIKKISLFLF